MDEPKCIEVSSWVSTGGKVQLVKFELNADYSFGESRKYSIPEGWTEQQVSEFHYEKTIELRGQIEPLAQQELDDLIAQKQQLKNG